MTENLKPCPFCGGEAAISAREHTKSYKVQCGGCGIKIGFGFSFIHPTTEAEAILAWNSRQKDALKEELVRAWNGTCGRTGITATRPD